MKYEQPRYDILIRGSHRTRNLIPFSLPSTTMSDIGRLLEYELAKQHMSAIEATLGVGYLNIFTSAFTSCAVIYFASLSSLSVRPDSSAYVRLTDLSVVLPNSQGLEGRHTF